MGRDDRRDRRRLAIRRETLRALASLGDRQLARVAGGTGGGVLGDETFYSMDCWTQTETMSTGSRFC